ncbi:MAG: twin-arginine translocation signal domain-containing protein [Mesorhizobium sp.]|nr:twin-arginine translocation signal domain-containing protein [Mesorhizobium sp. M1E.F.Ca.ET.041.01.1.1]RUW86104.1 twin-arginine translocation signal domain-containing protein [Mesorhizobium sp. M1E.F.Ca.ET.063.01.1.1]RWD89976.1 MAG: twin-arginine translocation signal domain-containing protein [Mesorhizobium sp.]RWD95955.1 MAG: twin-arginine translocation signal domain-containing protein [Mesorhizobium sp.]TIV55860.1 MAG: twin-arginine translocation signal domain-containing protein [Mesorhizo
MRSRRRFLQTAISVGGCCGRLKGR